MKMPLQISKYSLQINNLKFLCSYLSREHAVLLAKEKGITVDMYQEFISIEKHRKIMKYAMAAGFEFDDFDSQHFEGYSVVRIYKEAPILFQLVNHIDKSFEVAMRIIDNHKPINSVHLSTSYSYSANFPATVKKAAYFLTSWEIWTVPPDSKKPTSREGYNLGLGNLKNNSVSYNIEFRFDLEVLLHEIVHLKHDQWGERVIHEAAALVAQDCPRLLEKVKGLKPKLDLEIKRIARDFARFDYKVGQILGINEANPLGAHSPLGEILGVQ